MAHSSLRWLMLLLLALGPRLSAQIGGDAVYEFLNLAPSARVTALGGSAIATFDNDVALALFNPALAQAGMHRQLSLNTNFYFADADILSGYLGYAEHIAPWKMTLHGGLQFVDYGTFEWTDETGAVLGSFRANEYAFTLGAGRQYSERLYWGANVKAIVSQLEGYRSAGLALDVAGVYRDTASRFTASLVIRNAGAQLSTYAGTRERLPLDIQFGVSKRLRNLPLQFSIIAHHLQRWNILYDDPNAALDQPLLLGGTDERSASALFFDNLFRHFIFSGEFFIGKSENLRLRVGYNHLRRAELQVQGFRSMGGFSFGVGVKLSHFRLEYGRGLYHLAGGVNHLSLSTDLNALF